MENCSSLLLIILFRNRLLYFSSELNWMRKKGLPSNCEFYEIDLCFPNKLNIKNWLQIMNFYEKWINQFMGHKEKSGVTKNAAYGNRRPKNEDRSTTVPKISVPIYCTISVVKNVSGRKTENGKGLSCTTFLIRFGEDLIAYEGARHLPWKFQNKFPLKPISSLFVMTAPRFCEEWVERAQSWLLFKPIGHQWLHKSRHLPLNLATPTRVCQHFQFKENN